MTAFKRAVQPLGHALLEVGERFDNVVVVDADLQHVMETEFFMQRFPHRHFNVGIAEANMVGTSLGLALSGKTVFCGTFACFATQRVADQVATLAHCEGNVKIIGMEPALAAGSNGATHQGMLDLAIMRSMPNMTVFDPCDATEIRAVVHYLAEHPGPAYMRALRKTVLVLLDADTYRFEAGRALRLREGTDVTLIACGIMVERALQAADRLAAEGVSARLVNMSSIKPLDTGEVLAAAEQTGCIVTAENHSILGGLGSAVAETVTGVCPVPVVRIGIRDVFGEVGTMEYLAEKYCLGPAHIVAAAREALEIKTRMRASALQ
jgi:transketolase